MEIRMNRGRGRRLQTKRIPARAFFFVALIFLFAGRLLTGVPALAEEESEKISFRFIDNEEVREFETDYGFSEDRAWVRGLDQQTYLINPAGEIIYTVPKRVVMEDTSEEVVFDRFYPVENGVAWFTGRTRHSVLSETDISFIIDKDGNEIACFMNTEDVTCYIAGRTNDRFLLVWNDISGLTGKLYFIPIGLDGQAADVPRLMTDETAYGYATEVEDMGEGVFFWAGVDDDDQEFHAYYNLNSNTVQKSFDYACYNSGSIFYKGRTLSKGYLLTVDQLQEDRDNLVISNGQQYKEGINALSQYGNVWMDGPLYGGEPPFDNYIYDRTGAKLDIPDEIGRYGFADVSASDDGYVLFQESSPTGKTLLSMMDPDYRFLYVQKTFPEEITLFIGRGGYVTVNWRNQRGEEFVYGVIDRAGDLHTFEDDLSVFPDLAKLRFKGFGSGWLLETSAHLGDPNWTKATAVIRSLDGREEISSLKRTSDTRTLDGVITGTRIPDLSQAKPVGLAVTENAATEMTSEDEVRAMAEDGIIYLEKRLNQKQDVLLFEKEGIRLTCRIIPNDGWVFTLENNHPENKEAFATLSTEAEYDGITISGSGGHTYSVSAGKTSWFSASFETEREFMIAMGQYSQRLGELPLTEITIHFTVGIGHNVVDYTRTLRSASWSEEAFSVLYEEFVGDYQYNGNLIYSVYRVPNERQAAFVIRNRTDTELITGPSSLYLLSRRFVNGSKSGDSLKIEIQPGGIAIVSFGNIDQLYTKHQVADGIPLNLELSIPLPGDEAHTVFSLDLGQISNTPERKDEITYIPPKPGSKEDEKGNRVDVSVPEENKTDEPDDYLEEGFELIDDCLFRNGELFCDFSAFGGVRQIRQIGDQFWIITRDGYFYVMNLNLQTMSENMIPLNPEAKYVLNEYGLFETIYENFRPIVSRRIAADGSVLSEYENMDVEDILAPYRR